MKGKSFGTNDWKEVIAALRMLKVQTGSFACLGCGYEHSCSTNGCAILRAAADLLESQTHDRSLAEPLTQADLDKMNFDKVWLSYGAEPDDGEWALVYRGQLYSIDNLEGAGFEDMLNDLIRGEALDHPTGEYSVYRCSRSSEHIGRERWVSVEDRLPEEEKPVLAYYGFYRENDELGARFTGTLTYFCHDLEPHWQHESTGLFVTHWMPLPDPPGESG